MLHDWLTRPVGKKSHKSGRRRYARLEGKSKKEWPTVGITPVAAVQATNVCSTSRKRRKPSASARFFYLTHLCYLSLSLTLFFLLQPAAGPFATDPNTQDRNEEQRDHVHRLFSSRLEEEGKSPFSFLRLGLLTA